MMLRQPEATLPLNTISALDPTISQGINLLPNLSQTRNPTDPFACHHAPPMPSLLPLPDCSLTVIQSKSISISLKPGPEKSSPDSPGGLSTYVLTIRGSDCSNPSGSEFSYWQAHAKDTFLSSPRYHTPIFSKSKFTSTNQKPISGETATMNKEASGISFPGLTLRPSWREKWRR